MPQNLEQQNIDLCKQNLPMIKILLNNSKKKTVSFHKNTKRNNVVSKSRHYIFCK